LPFQDTVDHFLGIAAFEKKFSAVSTVPTRGVVWLARKLFNPSPAIAAAAPTTAGTEAGSHPDKQRSDISSAAIATLRFAPWPRK